VKFKVMQENVESAADMQVRDADGAPIEMVAAFDTDEGWYDRMVMEGGRVKMTPWVAQPNGGKTRSIAYDRVSGEPFSVFSKSTGAVIASYGGRAL
jgi:hypothetical protein